MKKMLLFLFAMLLPIQVLGAPSLTLDEALAVAQRNHPLIIEAKEVVAGAEARTGQSAANYYPQVSIAADWSRGRTFLTALESIRTTEVSSGALYLRQTIYDFGRTAGAVAASRSNRDAADEALAVTRQDLTLRVKAGFYLLLAADRQVTATKETVRAREDVFRQAQEFFQEGIRPRVDVARAEANFFSARTALVRAENNRDIARLELANAMGITSLGDTSVAEPTSDSVALPEKDAVLREGWADRAELKQLAALEAAATANLKTAKGSYLPVFSGVASLGYADRDLPPRGNVWGVGLNLTVPLFSGFSSVEQVREASAAINAVAARRATLRLQITKEVESAWLGVKEALARQASTEKESAAAEENRALAEGRYREGVGSIIEVTDAQSLALDAQTARIQAQYDYYLTLARLERATGKR